ncbi:hypothetical protein QR680_015617 [Steinernema hermaphroditum]|uniref:DNA2/NAM7 helicase-like C-terminal domain-containing protein n=1 Tax=Steinernema hermaphroditum TaxID=289476 RepID=A0AA39LL79_9BILA|nr:hypothetical protein QR680_015617 [Steinernema hermaphroditum]
MQNSTSDFDELLPYTQWVYNTSISSVTHETPFTLVFGREPIMALDKILNPRSHETFNSEQIEEFRETLFVNLRESWIAAHENAEIDRQKRKEKYDESASETTIKVDQLMSVRGQVHHLDRPAPYTAIACTRGKAVLALTDLTIEAPVVVDIASTTNFVGPAPTLYNYPVLPGETFNLLVYVQRSHPDGGLRRYHGPRTKLASLWMKDCGAFTTNATALELEKTGTVKIRRTIAYVQHVPENTRKSIQIVAPGFRGQLPLKANQIDSGMFNPPPTSGDRVLLTAVEIPHGFKRGRGRSYYLPASLVSGLQESAIRGTEFAPIWLQRDGIEHIKFIDEPRTTEVVSPEEREERLHNYEDNVLAAALFTQNRIQSARRKAGGIASFSPTDEEWRLAFDLKAPTDKDIAEQLSANKSNRRKPTQDEINEKRTEIVTERTKEWNSEGVIQIGTSHHDLRRTQWQTSEVQVSPEGQVTGFASPADPSEVEKEFPEFRTNEGVTEDESVTEGHFSKLNIEVEHPDKKMWIQPSTRHTGMESRINACEGRMISAAHEEETSRGLITRQLMANEDLPELNAEQLDAVHKICSPACQALLVQAPAGTGKTRVLSTMASLLTEDAEACIVAVAPTNNATRNLAYAIAKQVESAKDSMLILLSISAEKVMKDAEDEDAVTQYKKYRLTSRLESLDTTNVPDDDKKFIPTYVKKRSEMGSKGEEERRALALALDYGGINLICATVSTAELFADQLKARATVLLVDEAGQIATSQTVALTSRLPHIKKIVLAGDVKQLPTFSHGISRRITAPATESTLVTAEKKKTLMAVELKKSYRSHPYLVQAVAPWYDHKLLPEADPEERDLLTVSNLPLPNPAAPLLLLHVTDGDTKTESSSRQNLAQENIAVSLLKKIPELCNTYAITVLCYYRGSAENIRAAIKEEFPEDEQFAVETVDSYQGREEEVVVLVTTRSPRKKRLHRAAADFVEEDDFALSDERAIVSLTRARSGLVVIGNLHHLKKAPSWKSFLEATDDVPILTSQYADLLIEGPISAAVLRSLETEI